MLREEIFLFLTRLEHTPEPQCFTVPPLFVVFERPMSKTTQTSDLVTFHKCFHVSASEYYVPRLAFTPNVSCSYVLPQLGQKPGMVAFGT